MDSINQIFSYYDLLVNRLSPGNQALVSLIVLLILLINIYHFIKSGHWLFLLCLIIFIPSAPGAGKKLLYFIWFIIKGLLIRLQT